MKQNAAFAVLVAATIAATGLMVFYNLELRESFAVSVGYQFPAVETVPQPESKPAAPAAAEPYIADREPDDVPTDYEPLHPPEEQTPVVRFPLELNAAVYGELVQIPQVGDVMAQRILQYRDHLGGYTSLEQLREIKGVGDKVFATISAYLYLESEEDTTSPGEESS